MFDTSKWNELELKMYILIKERLASKWELDNCYTLDEAIKLFALYKMEKDIENMAHDELKQKMAEKRNKR